MIERGDLGAEGVAGAVEGADRLRLEVDGGWADAVIAGVDVGEAALDEAAGGENDDAVDLDVLIDDRDEVRARGRVPGGDG